GSRMFPHFGRASCSHRVEKSEMCAGTRRKVFSSFVSGVRCEMTVDGDRDVTSHQARTRLRPTSKTTAASAFFLVAFTFVFGKTHFITKARAIHLPALAK